MAWELVGGRVEGVKIRYLLRLSKVTRREELEGMNGQEMNFLEEFLIKLSYGGTLDLYQKDYSLLSISDLFENKTILYVYIIH